MSSEAAIRALRDQAGYIPALLGQARLIIIACSPEYLDIFWRCGSGMALVEGLTLSLAAGCIHPTEDEPLFLIFQGCFAQGTRLPSLFNQFLAAVDSPLCSIK
jgi:hypothetical protein